MAQGPDGKTIIIVKKVSGHGGHHGGSWKVAYADFVTSMMCLFMVLWLVNSASVVTRERIASYFRRPGVFDVGSGAPLELAGAGILPDAFSPPAEGEAQTELSEDIYKAPPTEGLKKSGFAGGPLEKAGHPDLNSPDVFKEQLKMEQAASDIGQVMKKDQKMIAGLLGNVTVKLDQRGLHLEIMDTEKASMFESGSARIHPRAEEELKKIAQALFALPNPIDIEGHTDAVPFRASKSASYDNWNLSTDRANAARRVLEAGGVDQLRIARVVGFAAQRPKVVNNPLDPSNRRISISMRYTDQASSALSGRNAVESENGKLISKETAAPVVPAEQHSIFDTVSGDATPGTENAEEGVAPTLDQMPLESAKVKGTGSGLQIQLETRLPEGAVVAAPEAAPRQPWMEKDKIFGNENPFFSK